MPLLSPRAADELSELITVTLRCPKMWPTERMRWVVGFGAVAVLAASGCGSTSKSSSTTTADLNRSTSTLAASPSSASASSTSAAKKATPKPCDLVTKAEAETLAGTTLGEPIAAQMTCTFTGPPTGPLAQVEVFVGDGAKKFLDIDRDTLNHKFDPAPGIGDEALIEENVIFLRKGATWVSLRLVLLNDPAENRPRLEALAATVASRL